VIDALAPMSQPDFDPPWVDLQFEIRSAQWSKNPSRLIIDCVALADHSEVGFGIEIHRDGWNRVTTDEEQVWFDWGKGAFHSTGEPSNSFVGLLAALFGIQTPQKFVSRLECDVVLLCGNPDMLDSAKCQSKFFLGEAGDDEGQVFVNWDAANGRVEFREKDPEFRVALLRELTVH